MKTENLKKSFVPVGIMLLGVILFVMVTLDITDNKAIKTDTKSTVAMGTVVTEKLYDSSDSEKTFEIIEKTITELENEISIRIESSKLSKLNKSYSVKCDDELISAFKSCNEVYEKSNGAFDITMGKVTTLWKIGEAEADVPSEKKIKKALSAVDGSRVNITNNEININNGQYIDLGAIGKGLACDKVREKLEEANEKSAVISVGGSVLLYGSNPNSQPWSVAVRDPRGESSDYIGKLSLQSGVVSTSGDYERVLEKNGKKYHHILDPKTGYPSKSGLMSVTVVCDSGLLSDSLSTAAFILGTADGMKLLKEFDAEGVFVDEDKNVFVTDGLADKFELTNDAYVLSGDER